MFLHDKDIYNEKEELESYLQKWQADGDWCKRATQFMKRNAQFIS